MAHDLMVIPTKAMKPGEEAYAIGCAVPVNSPESPLVRNQKYGLKLNLPEIGEPPSADVTRSGLPPSGVRSRR